MTAIAIAIGVEGRPEVTCATSCARLASTRTGWANKAKAIAAGIARPANLNNSRSVWAENLLPIFPPRPVLTQFRMIELLDASNQRAHPIDEFFQAQAASIGGLFHSGDCIDHPYYYGMSRIDHNVGWPTCQIVRISGSPLTSPWTLKCLAMPTSSRIALS